LVDSYKESVIKKYGKNSKAVVVKKNIQDFSYINKNSEKIEEIFYIFEYEYFLRKNKFSGYFSIENKKFYDLIEINSEIPILAVYAMSKLSKVRIIKLGKNLGLSRKESK
jgi:hypothetical protein